ncbi:MAG: hypothetical protein AAGJ18_00880 [Bacteroidota bacterium]
MAELTKEHQALYDEAIKLITKIDDLPRVYGKEYALAERLIGKEIPYTFQELVHKMFKAKVPIDNFSFENIFHYLLNLVYTQGVDPDNPFLVHFERDRGMEIYKVLTEVYEKP